jgi:glycosyltransferase involved in cell wall biosynthesis
MKFILIGNYPPDKQESMKKYAVTLRDNLLHESLQAEIIYPTIFFGYMAKTTVAGIGKWLGYLDKWILFPIVLRFKLLFSSELSNQDTFFHICDHSNSPYFKSLPAERTGITCHDVLAIRGARGYKDAYCPASATGKILQNWIFKNLKKAKILTTVSQLTMNQLLELCGDTVPGDQWKVIHNSFNGDFAPVNIEDSTRLLGGTGIAPGQPFILTVGSSLPRKNRKMLLEMTAALKTKWDGLICFAGQPLNETLLKQIKEFGLEDRVISIVKPDHATLLALYSSCTAFIFPSYSEGFGWPLIEAQACGAPVIASNVEPMPEISNGTAIHADPNQPVDFANGLQLLLDPLRRCEFIELGFKNALRFDSRWLTREFIGLYIKSRNN